MASRHVSEYLLPVQTVPVGASVSDLLLAATTEKSVVAKCGTILCWMHLVAIWQVLAVATDTFYVNRPHTTRTLR